MNIPSTSTFNPHHQQDYKERFLIINEKYLDEKAKGIDYHGGLMRLKCSV
jgi:hypothetical protein